MVRNFWGPKYGSEYTSVREQSYELEIPEAQKANLQGLITKEAEIRTVLLGELKKDAEVTKRIAGFYEREDDKAVYVFMCDGHAIAVNNFSAMAGMKRELDKRPGGVYLVHKLGSQVDFNLVERLRKASR